MGGGKIKHHIFIRHGIITKTAQRYKKFFIHATRTRIFLRIVTKNLRIVTLLSPKKSIFPHRYNFLFVLFLISCGSGHWERFVSPLGHRAESTKVP